VDICVRREVSTMAKKENKKPVQTAKPAEQTKAAK
jgi:hypothetical protein